MGYKLQFAELECVDTYSTADWKSGVKRSPSDVCQMKCSVQCDKCCSTVFKGKSRQTEESIEMQNAWQNQGQLRIILPLAVYVFCCG
jgi:hypothetical protein